MAFPVEIHTSNLRVREFAGDDLSRFLHLSLDSDAVRYLAFGPTSEAEARAMIEFVIGSARAPPRPNMSLPSVMQRRGISLSLCRVFGQAHLDNQHSIATMENIGMAHDSVRENSATVEGTQHGQDGVRYAILNR